MAADPPAIQSPSVEEMHDAARQWSRKGEGATGFDTTGAESIERLTDRVDQVQGRGDVGPGCEEVIDGGEVARRGRSVTLMCRGAVGVIQAAQWVQHPHDVVRVLNHPGRVLARDDQIYMGEV